MKTLVVTPDFPPERGGIQLLVHRVVECGRRLGPRVVTFTAPGAREFDAASGISTRRIRQIPGPKPASIALLNMGAVREALAFTPDVVLSAHIVTSPAAALIRHALKVPVVQYFYGKEIGARPGLAAFASHNADASIAISRYTQELVVGVGGDPERLHCIPPGVDLAEGERLPRSTRPTVVTIARLEDRYKGHDVMVRAMALIRRRVPGIRWIVIGDGPLRPSLVELARAHGLDDGTVEFLGAASDEERDAWLDRASVLAMPSRQPAAGFAGEGFGIVYLEANTHGRPVVAGDGGGATDAVVHGETGLMVNPTDHVAVATALTELLTKHELAERLGANGASRAGDFAWPAIAGRVEELLLSLRRS